MPSQIMKYPGGKVNLRQDCCEFCHNTRITRGGRPEDRPPAHEGNFPAYMAKVQGSLLLSPFGVTTER